MPADLTEAAAQLRRLLLALPELEGGKAHSIADVATAVGASVEVLARDLRTLVTRTGDEPGGFFERIQLLFDADQVQLQSNMLSRPMGLTPSELRAIELGLAMLASELAPEDAAIADEARERVRSSAVKLPRRLRSNASEAVGGIAAVRIASFETVAPPPLHLATVRDAIVRRRKALIRYQSAEADGASERTVRPYGLVLTGGRWYLVAFCETREDIRIFRVDRISNVGVLEAAESKIPEAFSLDDVLKHGRALANEASEWLRIRYAPHIARWIVEHEVGTWDVDGSFVVDHPLLDDRWAVRHALQYGADAEVLAPERIRQAIVERLHAAVGPEPMATRNAERRARRPR